jgi:hypothetical protein
MRDALSQRGASNSSNPDFINNFQDVGTATQTKTKSPNKRKGLNLGLSGEEANGK